MRKTDYTRVTDLQTEASETKTLCREIVIEIVSEGQTGYRGASSLKSVH